MRIDETVNEPAKDDSLVDDDEQDLSEYPVTQTTLTVDGQADGLRLDKFLTLNQAELTRSAAVRLIESGCVSVFSGNRKPRECDKNLRLQIGDEVCLEMPQVSEWNVAPQDIPIDVVYEDDDIIVVNKPSGMVVHPAPGNPDGTLVNALLYHCMQRGDTLSGIGGVRRPGIVHRIDKDTSGLLVIAKNDVAHLSLCEQLKTHTVSRIYRAVCIGNIKQDAGTLDMPVGRHPTDRKKMKAWSPSSAPRTGTKQAVTHYDVKARYYGQQTDRQTFTEIECRLETGRTHQIRVHFATIGHPLLGDPVYGGDGTEFERNHKLMIHGQMLHAGTLKLIHPKTGKEMIFTAPPPDDFCRVVSILSDSK